MKKSIILSIIFMLILIISTSVCAASGELSATLEGTTDKQTVLPGEQIVLTLTLKDIQNLSGEGVTNITTSLDYDENIFEEVIQENIESTLLAIYNDNDGVHELTIATTTGLKEDTEIAKITFKVRENALNTSTNITLKNTAINESNGEASPILDTQIPVQIGIEEIPTVALTKIEITKKPTKTVYKIGEKFDATGMEIKATYSDNTTKTIDNYTFSPMGELKETDKAITITYKEGTVTKTVEQSITVNETGTLPGTGLENYSIILILAILAIAIYSFIKLRKYNNI